MTTTDANGTAAALPTIHELMARVITDVRGVPKTGENTEFHYKFRGVDAVTDAVGIALRKHGVWIVPSVVERTRDTRQGHKSTLTWMEVGVVYTFMGPRGDSVAVGPIFGESTDAGMGDKVTAKAMSVAYRIALLQTFAIPSGDVDPDAATQGDELAPPYQPTQGDRDATARLVDTYKALPEACRPDGRTLLQETAADYQLEAPWAVAWPAEVADQLAVKLAALHGQYDAATAPEATPQQPEAPATDAGAQPAPEGPAPADSATQQPEQVPSDNEEELLRQQGLL